MHTNGSRPTILVVEDSNDLVILLRRVLNEHGFEVRVSRDGDAGLRWCVADPPDLVILDVGLPGRDGLQVAAELRRHGLAMPVLMLTARCEVSDRVTGLEAGADDYLAKPFDQRELVARVRALLRRASVRVGAKRICLGDLVLDPLTREVARGDRRLVLTQREFSLLEYFMRNAGRAVTREMIAREVWRETPIDVGETNIVDVYVAYLRRKLDADDDEPILHTVRGIGYLLQPAPVAAAAAPAARD